MIMNMNKRKSEIQDTFLFLVLQGNIYLLSYIEIIDSDKNMAKKEFTISHRLQ